MNSGELEKILFRYGCES